MGGGMSVMEIVPASSCVPLQKRKPKWMFLR